MKGGVKTWPQTMSSNPYMGKLVEVKHTLAGKDIKHGGLWGTGLGTQTGRGPKQTSESGKKKLKQDMVRLKIRLLWL